MSGIEEWTDQIHQGDAREVLSKLPDDSIHMAMFSPPYWGMRDYGTDDQIGLEESFEDYVGNLAAIADELQRVVRDDGSWWLNIGDGFGQPNTTNGSPSDRPELKSTHSTLPDGMSDKCKMMLPHRVAMEMVERDWVARNDAIWRKTNPMPESVKDRLSTTFEMLFHFVQQKEYHYNLDAIRDPYETDLETEPPIGGVKHQDNMNNTYSGNTPERTGKGKNPGDVFDLPTDDYPGGHFAVYPPELVKKPLLATCPEKVCANCGAPYEPHGSTDTTEEQNTETLVEEDDNDRDETTGLTWSQTCDCETDETQPGIVLDPMCGRGTTCKVAAEHGRRYIGIEINPEYAEKARDYVPNSRQQSLADYSN